MMELNYVWLPKADLDVVYLWLISVRSCGPGPAILISQFTTAAMHLCWMRSILKGSDFAARIIVCCERGS